MTREKEIINAASEYGCLDKGETLLAFTKGAKWTDENPDVKLAYTKKQLLDMGFSFTTNGDIVTPEQLEEDWKELEKFSEVGPVADEYVEQCKENVKGGKATITYKICDDGMELIIPFNEEIVYDKCRWILRKKQPQYPKTYEECCEVLGSDPSKIIVLSNRKDIIHEENKHCYEMYNLYQLLICRDAYWKIAGEQMGLGKPWEPDWCNENKLKYCIECSFGTIDKTVSIVNGCVLAFPTKEMRDTFYENFKDLITECKELL